MGIQPPTPRDDYHRCENDYLFDVETQTVPPTTFAKTVSTFVIDLEQRQSLFSFEMEMNRRRDYTGV